jgi:flagellar motor switch protein FliG
MSNGLDQRIRHVAIVLQSLDAATSRGLLAQFPAAQAKQIRHAMVNLGSVSPQERSQAFQSMQGLLGSSASSANSSNRSDNESPASALLASHSSGGPDRVEWSDEGRQNAATGPGSSGSTTEGMHPGGFPSPEMLATLNSGRNHTWQHIPIETFADILHNERPIVIATVINHLSVDRATSVVQLLPIEVAGATLAALPHLHMTDAAILKDIEQEIERKIGHHRPQLQASSEGLSRLQAILAGMPESQKSIWLNAIAQSNPLLGSRLGWSPSHFTSQVPTTPPVAANPAQEPSEPAARSSSYDDVFEDPILLPIAGKSKTTAKNDSNVIPSRESKESRDETGTQDAGVQRLSTSSPQTSEGPSLDALATLSDRDFVAVLHACDPKLVLLAISGASKPLVNRVERLIPPKDIKRLRSRLANLGPIQLRDIDNAQRTILETAENLFLKGKIKALKLATFTAAA